MHFGFRIIGIISGFIWINKCTGAIPTVTLTASSSPYFDIGGSISFTCSINEDVNINAAYLTKDRLQYVLIQINSPSNCGLIPMTGNDRHVYSVTCEQRMTVHIVMNGTVATDHNSTWSCEMLSQSGICYSSCISTSSVTTALRVPVSYVQLKDGTGQLLVTPVPVLDGSSKDFRCDTSPNGSRPRALFNWYKRSENQSTILIQNQSVSTPSPKPEVDLSISISYSTLTLMGNRSYQNMYIYCEARDETNRGNFVKSTEAQLNIVYPPIVQLYRNTSVFNVTEGLSKFVFTCNVTDANPMPDAYSWFHGGTVIQGQTRSSYELLNVQKSHDGIYQCMARNNYGTGNSSTMYLNVQYGPTIFLIDYIEVEERENVSIACSVTANPQPDIVWSRNGTVILPSSDTLRIPYISRLNEGNYTCTASNLLYPTGQAPVSLMATDTLRISVLFGPGSSIYLTPNSSVYQVDEGQKAIDIICRATCNPACSYRWIKGNVQINSSNTLSLGIVQKNVTGNYNCEAFNTIRGQRKGSNRSVEVFVRYVPDIPSNVTVYDVKPTSLTVQWVAGYDGGLKQTFHIMITASDITRSVYAPDPGYGKLGTQTIEDLIPNTEYSIFMSANNSVGSSSVTNVIIRITLKEGTPETLGIPVAGIAGGVSAGIVLILVMALGIFLWRRSQQKKQNEDENDVLREETERTSVSPITNRGGDIRLEENRNDNTRPPENNSYEKLHMYANSDIKMYSSLKIQRISKEFGLEENRSANTRPPENDSYEKLHPYTNTDIQMYSSLKIPKTSKDSERMYENTQIM